MKILNFIMENKDAIVLILGVVGVPIFNYLASFIPTTWHGHLITILLGLYILSLK